MIKNEIVIIISDKKDIFRDVSAITRFKTGSDHRLLRGTVCIDLELERSQLVKSTHRLNLLLSIVDPGTFKINLENRFAALKNTVFVDIDKELDRVVGILRDEGVKVCGVRRTGTKAKNSMETLDLMDKR